MTPEIRHWEKMRDNLAAAMAQMLIREPPMVMTLETDPDYPMRRQEPRFHDRPISPLMRRAQETLAELNLRIETEWEEHLQREIAAAMTPLPDMAAMDPDLVVTARYR